MTANALERTTGRASATVLGDRRVEVDPRSVAESRLPVTDRSIEYECFTAGRIEGEWRGVPVDRLLEEAEVPPETTHLLFVATDGLQACVPLAAALGGLLAVERAGDRLDAPRFVAPGIGGPRAVKDVQRVEPVSLAPGEERHAYEDLSPAEESGRSGEATGATDGTEPNAGRSTRADDPDASQSAGTDRDPDRTNAEAP